MKMLLALLAVGAAIVAGVRVTGWSLPDRYDPWAPLAIDDPPGWLTRYKLHRLDDDPTACRALLATTPFETTPVPDRETAPGCVLHDVVRIRRTDLQLDAPFLLSCPAAASLALWERHVVQPAAREILGAPVRRLEHFGSYACRNLYGRESGPRSQHASADALDVAGFVLADGRRVTVAGDFRGAGADARFLHAVHDGACRFFDGVYGPDYNREHADHFHLDRGPYRLCR